MARRYRLALVGANRWFARFPVYAPPLRITSARRS